MSRVFAITTDRETVQLDLEGKGEVAFTVTNSTERPLRGVAKISPQDSTKAQWLSIAGELERDYPANATQQVAVKIAVPPGTLAGRYPFRLNVSSTANPDDDYGEGPLVILESVEVKKPFPWWIIAAIVALVLVGGGMAVYLLMPKKVNVPNVITLTLQDAEKKISERGLVAKQDLEHSEEDPSAKEDRVLNQDPNEGQLKEGGIITLTLQLHVPPFPMPDFKGAGKTIKEAEEFIKSKKYVTIKPVIVETDTKPEGTILEQSPEKDQPVNPGDTVTLTFAVPVVPFSMPKVIGEDVGTASSELTKRGLKVTSAEQEDSRFVPGTVVAQTPQEGAPVKSGSPVTLTAAYTNVIVPPITYATWQLAEAALKNTGLYLSQVQGDCKSSVSRSEPMPNTVVRKGSSVVLYTEGDQNKVCYRSIRSIIISERSVFRDLQIKH